MHIKDRNDYATYICSEFETLAWRIVDEVAHDYPAKWVDSLITHNYYNWGGKNLLQVRLNRVSESQCGKLQVVSRRPTKSKLRSKVYELRCRSLTF